MDGLIDFGSQVSEVEYGIGTKGLVRSVLVRVGGFVAGVMVVGITLGSVV